MLVATLDRARAIVQVVETMATDATGPPLRRPPPLPSTGNAASRDTSVRSTRRTSNRPPPRSFIGAPSSAASRQPPVPNPQAKATAPSTSSSAQAAPAPTSPTPLTSDVRDELVRRVMPELRTLTEQLVKASVERSVASLLERQRELEVKVERAGGMARDLDAKIAAALAPVLAKQRELEQMLDALRHRAARPEPLLGRPAPALPTQAAAQRPMPVEGPAPLLGPRPDALAAAALSTNALVDIPAELNGSRRKRMVVILLLVLVIGVLATVASLSVMSNMGPHP